MSTRPRKSESASSASRSQQVTSAMEDYLKAIYRLEGEDGVVSMAQVTGELNVRGASVTNMLKRMSDLRLVDYEPYKGVSLTDSGRKIALEIVRHHRLLELYLSESLGMPWHEVHAEAELLEHHLSDELEARMDSALGFPTHDPHGDPIPSPDLVLPGESGIDLTLVEPGQSATVSRVSDRNPEQLEYLGTLGLYPGAQVAVIERMPFEGPLRIRVGDHEAVLGPALARQVVVSLS
ncbi:MAG TPA: metal-dependent transcriptional regulator [Thermomicrobiales bacterium]|nr:metal-dependent transcriptional regulator [Thermomicrobiales bacterium]